MENKTMFVIMFDCGRYEDQTSNVIAVIDNLEKANNYVNGKNAIYDSMRNKLELLSKAKEKWLKDNPKPMVKEYQEVVITRWNSNEKITKEMRSDRAKLKKINEDRRIEAMKEVNNWNHALLQFSQEWMKIHLTEDELNAQKIDDDHFYYVEEVPLL